MAHPLGTAGAQKRSQAFAAKGPGLALPAPLTASPHQGWVDPLQLFSPATDDFPHLSLRTQSVTILQLGNTRVVNSRSHSPFYSHFHVFSGNQKGAAWLRSCYFPVHSTPSLQETASSSGWPSLPPHFKHCLKELCFLQVRELFWGARRGTGKRGV